MVFFLLKKMLFIYLLLERRQGRERGRETSIDCLWYMPCALTSDQAHSPGTCPDQESNLRPLLCGMMLNQLSHTGQGCTVVFHGKHLLSLLERAFSCYSFVYYWESLLRAALSKEFRNNWICHIHIIIKMSYNLAWQFRFPECVIYLSIAL